MTNNIPNFLFLLAALPLAAQAPAGRWDGEIVLDSLRVPFTLHLSPAGQTVAGAFENGGVRTESISGSFDGNQLRLDFGPAGRLQATVVDGALKGSHTAGSGPAAPFSAAAYCTCGFEGDAGPAIAGIWEMAEPNWKLAIERAGEDTRVTVTRPGGSIGPVTGRHDGLAFQLHFFDGARAALLELEEQKNGTLRVTWKEPGKGPVVTSAVRRSN